MCIVCIANTINRNVYIYLNTHIFPTTGYARVLLFMFIRRELGGTGTGCLFQFTYCVVMLCSTYVVSFLVLQSSRCGRERDGCLKIAFNVMGQFVLCVSSSQCNGLVCSV